MRTMQRAKKRPFFFPGTGSLHAIIQYARFLIKGKAYDGCCSGFRLTIGK